ncbi:hypothetical protein H2201_006423 [Coniosporium apollinis]|uniref:MARVEL domain-containing protein n=2 Tax=Coniosporium TaxID=2810619 RepID=A0ABQ9NNT5_9PEZI|nr:hypothetical protein H2199_004549 [Cladosporium sp. JES 115]KAJ9661752.1 hypothetical protein H2201_006423 [Coniosporium apollinis]
MAPRGNKNDVWLKRVLVPFWTFRLFFMVILFGLQAWAIAVTAQKQDMLNGDAELMLVWFVLITICLLLDITAIIMFARHNLSPRTFLVFNVIQTTIVLVWFILDIITAVRSRKVGGLLVLSALIVLSFVALLIYSAVIVHRARRAGAYKPAHKSVNLESQSYPPSGVTAYNNDDIDTAYSLDTYTSYRSHSAPIELPQSTPHAGSGNDYHAPAQPAQQQTCYSPLSPGQTNQTPVSGYRAYSQAQPPQYQQVQEKDGAETHVAEVPAQ